MVVALAVVASVAVVAQVSSTLSLPIQSLQELRSQSVLGLAVRRIVSPPVQLEVTLNLARSMRTVVVAVERMNQTVQLHLKESTHTDLDLAVVVVT